MGQFNNSPLSPSLSPLWTSSTSEARKTGTWRSAVPTYKTLPSPCHGACPVNGEIAAWIQQVKNGDYYGGWLTLVDNNPFPAIAGRICHHPCESVCNRQHLDETVGICSLERFVGDMALAEKWQFPELEKQSSKTVAIVGTGPAGLSAAYQLRRQGYKVELFESKTQLGGLLRYGIPGYRLEKTILDAEIERILKLGISVNLNSDISGKQKLQLLHDKYDAVFLATGASKSKALPNLDYEQSWVIDSAKFLASTEAEKENKSGQRLLVIGGGSAAIDVARSARRLGKQVTVLALEPENLLPAQKLEVDEAKEEAIEFITASMMQSVTEGPTGLTVHCIKVDFKPSKDSGKFTVDPISSTEFDLSIDSIIPSIGQDVDLGLWNDLLETSGAVFKTDNNHQTSLPGVFAGGDLATMNRFVTEAIGMGKQAAKSIGLYLEDEAYSEPVQEQSEVAYSVINTYYHPEVQRNKSMNTEVEQRLQNFKEVQQVLSNEAAIAESNRCFSCGSCIYCDSCFYHCPDMAITRLGKGYEIKSDFCKGCGLCVAECPTGSIVMHEES